MKRKWLWLVVFPMVGAAVSTLVRRVVALDPSQYWPQAVLSLACFYAVFFVFMILERFLLDARVAEDSSE